MKKIFASQLNASNLGKRVRIRLGADTAVEDVVKGINHELSGSYRITLVKLSTIDAPTGLIAIPGDRMGWFRFSTAQEIEVLE